MARRKRIDALSTSPQARPTVSAIISSMNTDHARVLLGLELDDKRIGRSIPPTRWVLAHAWCKNHALVGRGPLAGKLLPLGERVLVELRECPTWSVRLDSILMEARGAK